MDIQTVVLIVLSIMLVAKIVYLVFFKRPSSHHDDHFQGHHGHSRHYHKHGNHHDS